MDGFINSKVEKHTIYEIYRACRLCGAGAGYKMPIIQNVVDLDGTEVELKQKVRECVQIEVHQDDKMPPLICELCVDKVNDFYEFLEMCRQTNKRTRLRLGLPPQTLPRGAPDAGDCILGVTEPIFVDNEDSNEPIQKSKGKSTKLVKIKKEPESKDKKNKLPKVKEEPEHRNGKNKVNVTQKKDNIKKEETKVRIEPRSLRSKAPSPPRLRGTKRPHEDDVSLSSLQKIRKPEPPMPRSILKREKETKIEDLPKLTRSREKESNTKAAMCKKVKIVLKPMPLRPGKLSANSPSPKPLGPKSLGPKPLGPKSLGPKTNSSPNVYRCPVCKVASFDNSRSLEYHIRWHNSQKQVENKPPPKKESRRIECRTCNKQFPNKNLLDIHRCTIGRSVKQHVSPPKAVVRPQRKLPEPLPKKKSQGISPKLLKTLKPFQVRVARVDPLLRSNKIGEHYYVSDVDCDFGLDKDCLYPYISTFQSYSIKSEPSYMVNIHDEIKKAFDLDDSYVHWDSENETDSDLDFNETKKVDTLSSLSLKTIFSHKFLGKVPKKRRKAKVDKAFDSILNASEFDSSIRRGIDNIISSLDDDKDKSIIDSVGTNKKLDKSTDDNDSLFGDDKAPSVTNDDFDSLFSSKDISNIKNDSIMNDDSNETYVSSQDSESIDKTSQKDTKEVNNEVARDTISNLADLSTVQDSKSVENKEPSDVKESITHEIDREESTEINNISNPDETESSNNNKELEKSEDFTKDKRDISKEASIESITNNDKNDHLSKNEETHVNGQLELEEAFNMDDLEDVSDSEMEDNRLMEALDEQIYESGTAKAKDDVCESDRVNLDDAVPASVRSADLESISDAEFE